MPPPVEGLSLYGAYLFAEESAAAQGTPVAATTTASAMSDTLASGINVIEVAPIWDNAEVQNSVEGLVAPGGNLVVLPSSAAYFCYLMKWASRAHAIAALPGSMVTPPTAASSSGAGPVAGAYYYSVAEVLQETATGLLYSTNPIELASPITTSGGSLTVTLTITRSLVGTIPAGFTKAGVLIGRTAASGSSGTEKVLAYIASSSTATYVDSNLDTLTTKSMPTLVNQITFQSGTTPMYTFTLEKLLGELGSSEQYPGCKINSLSYSLEPGKLAECTFDIFANTQNTISSSAPSVPIPDIFVGQYTVGNLYLSGGSLTQTKLMRKFDVKLDNSLKRRYTFTGLNTAYRQKEGWRKADITLDLEFESIAQRTNFLAFNLMAAQVYTNGSPTSLAPIALTNGGTSSGTVQSWPAQMGVNLPSLRYKTDKTNLSGDNPIVQNLTAFSQYNATAGYGCQFFVSTTVSSLPDVS